MPPSASILVQMKNIHVSYGSVKALKGVSFDVYRGEVHALVGEHRAGKSSLVKLLSGVVRRSHGQIRFGGKTCGPLSPQSAIRMGVGMVYQNLHVVPTLSAVENVFADNPITRWFGVLDHRRMRDLTAELMQQLGVAIDVGAPLHTLTAGQQHLIEFAKVVRMDPLLLVLDEISNNLTPEEMKSIYRVILDYKARGKSTIYISHNVDEILQLADRVTVLKDGHRRGTENIGDLDRRKLFYLTYSFALTEEEAAEEEARDFFLPGSTTHEVAQNLPIGMIVLDREHAVRMSNFAAMNLFDFTLQLDGQPIDALVERLDPAARGQVLEAIEDHRKGSWDEVSASDKLLRIEVFPLRKRSGELRGTVLLLQDVSADRYIRDYLIQSEKMASIAQVAVGVAHEINNPLFIIQNYVELLRDKINDEDGALKLGKIEKELIRIVEIIGSLLSFSRTNPQPGVRVDLVRVVDEVLLLLQHGLTKKKIRVDRQVADTAVEVVGDQNKLEQLFINLIMNGIEALLEGGTIRVEILRAQEYAEVHVADNGHGIPEDIREEIFNPFFTSKLNKKNTGLGLTICRHIVEEHNGAISFSSVPGAETVFSVRLPLSAVSR